MQEDNTIHTIHTIHINHINSADYWVRELAKLNHYIEPTTADIINRGWQKRVPIVLEGPPGGGKTSLVKKIAQIKGAKFYRLQCESTLGKSQALYAFDETLQRISLEQATKDGEKLSATQVKQIIYHEGNLIAGILMEALQDENDAIILIDELDKASQDFEALLLEFLDEFSITVVERKETISCKAANRPMVLITSNAGIFGAKESLSRPLRRRCLYCYLPEATDERLVDIFATECPHLSYPFIIDCVLFVSRIKELAILEEPFSLSETKMWVSHLELKLKELGSSNMLKSQPELTTELVISTIDALAKSDLDIKRLTEETPSVIKYISKKRDTFGR